MDEDIQVLIVENLDVVDLLSFAEALNTTSYAIDYALRRRFQAKSVQIYSPADEPVPSVEENDNVIRIQDYSSVLRFLTDFGHSMNDIRITLNYASLSANQVATILQLINTHCSKSLKTFGIGVVNSDMPFGVFSSRRYSVSFNAFTQPFENVKSVILSSYTVDNLDSSTLNFQELFPGMRSLHLTSTFILRNFSSLETLKFPHLKSLSSNIAMRNTGEREEKQFDETICRNLIRNNPQIERLTSQYVTRGLLEFIANELPQLNYLRLGYYREDAVSNAICFENLETFIQELSMSHTMPGLISFGKLHTLRVDGYWSEIDDSRWVEVVRQQNTLKNLDVMGLPTLSDLREFANVRNSSLVSVLMDVFSFTGQEFVPKMECIIEIIENSEHLNEFMLFNGRNKKNHRVVLGLLQERLSSKWITTISENKQLVNVVRNTSNISIEFP